MVPKKRFERFVNWTEKKNSLEIPRINFIDLSLQRSLIVNFFFSIWDFSHLSRPNKFNRNFAKGQQVYFFLKGGR